METIISVFRPHIDTIPHIDVVHSKKFGWTLLTKVDRGEVPVFLTGRQHLMIVLAETFFDAVPGGTAREMASNARQMMAPYLAQLPADCTVTTEATLGLLAKLDD